MLLESPLSHSRIVLHLPVACSVIQILVQPLSLENVCRTLPELPRKSANELMSLLLSAKMILPVHDDGLSTEDESPNLQSWEFHDFLFHSRSRGGRHDRPAGGTFRLSRVMEPPPAWKAVPDGETVELYRPDPEHLKTHDLPFAKVQAERCSIRGYSKEAISAKQLGEFLYRVNHISGLHKMTVPSMSGPQNMELAFRPYPSGGALYELELYVLVNRCKNLKRGVYYHDPQHHRLIRVAAMSSDSLALLRDAGDATRIAPDRIQTLIVISARFQRIAWKYSTIAYSLLLKNVGALMQTMYLAATAMELAPCAVGYGDSDLFAKVANTDYVAETSVGEFLLGRKMDLPQRTRS